MAPAWNAPPVEQDAMILLASMNTREVSWIWFLIVSWLGRRKVLTTHLGHEVVFGRLWGRVYLIDLFEVCEAEIPQEEKQQCL